MFIYSIGNEKAERRMILITWKLKHFCQENGGYVSPMMH